LAAAQQELATLHPLERVQKADGAARSGELLAPAWWPDVTLEFEVSLHLRESLNNCVYHGFWDEHAASTMLQALRHLTASEDDTLLYRGYLSQDGGDWSSDLNNCAIERPVFEDQSWGFNESDESAWCQPRPGDLHEVWDNYERDDDAVIGIKRTLVVSNDGGEPSEYNEATYWDGEEPMPQDELFFRLDLLVCGPDPERTLADWHHVAELIRGAYPYERAVAKIEAEQRHIVALKTR